MGEEGWKVLLGGRRGHRFLLVGSQKLVRRGDAFTGQSVQVEEAGKPAGTQIFKPGREM